MNASNAVAFVIIYIIRLVNKIDNTQIIRTAQFTSYNVKKYGRQLNKLFLGVVPTIDKIYNKLDTQLEANVSLSNQVTLDVGNVTDNTEYINIFRDRLNISVKFSKANVNDGLLQELSTNEAIKYQGEAYLGITPFDNYYLFNLFNEVNGSEIPLDITNSGDLYINFIDNEQINIKQYINVTNLEKNQVVFKIDKESAQKILQFTENHFYITNKITTSDNQSDETVLYTGLFFDFKSIPDYQLRLDFNSLTANYNSLLSTYNTETVDKNNQINTLQSTIDNLTKLIQDYKLTNTKLSDLVSDKTLISAELDALKQSIKANAITTVNVNSSNIERIANTQQTSIMKRKSIELNTQITTQQPDTQVVDLQLIDTRI